IDIPCTGEQRLTSLLPRHTVAEPPEGAAPTGLLVAQQIDFGGNPVSHDAAIVARQHAQDGIQAPPDVQGCTHDVWLRVQPPPPESVAHDGDRPALVRFRVEPADRTANTEDIEKIRTGRHLPGNFVERGHLPIRIAEPGIACQILKYARMSEVVVSG